MTSQTLDFPHGLSVSYAFKVENVTTDGSPVDGTLASAQGSDGHLVPAGYKFVPKCVQAESNAAITAGSILVKATADGTELANGPIATLSSAAQASTAIAAVSEAAVAAGEVIGVSGTSSGALDAATKDLDVVLTGLLLPV